MQSYPALIIRKDRERALTNRHPWLFSGAIYGVEGEPHEGDIVRVTDAYGRLYAYGHYQGTKRSIAARLFLFTEDVLVIDDAFWIERFERALALRKTLGVVEPRSGYRFLFSEGDFIPGLVVDIFDDCAVIQVGSAGLENVVLLLLEFLKTKLGVKHIYDGKWLVGEKPEVEFVEGELTLTGNIESGQKTGYFFDQRDNRELVAKYAQGKNVLDAFCYSGGFTCHALKGGAASVTSVDISEDAIERCKSNVAANFKNDTRHNVVAADCFDYLREMEQDAYDLIVLDPPAFAKSAQAVDRAARGYKDINLVAMRNIRAGGLLFTFSCSQHISHDLFRKIIFGAAKDAGRSVRVLHQMTQAADHPVDICHLEGEYLKGLVLYVD
jgi:23S rRNA (cytosine1962-C5)-methyltransferase